ncbi:MAG: hypothetical protein M0R22_00230 [Dehalococcoidia bacterium]|jgi:hypothetical protein|nr:hypothetical protein [Dehalococcoidia bacterium]
MSKRKSTRCKYAGVTAAGKPYCMKLGPRGSGKTGMRFCKCPKSVGRLMSRDPYAGWK